MLENGEKNVKINTLKNLMPPKSLQINKAGRETAELPATAAHIW